jgi:hypothetical protein
MSGLSLAWHWHGLCVHVHLISHYGFVWSWGWLVSLPTLVNLKNRVFLLACNVWVMRWAALLCHAMRMRFRYGCSHMDSRCGHVSLSLMRHSVQLGFWYLRGQNMFFLWFPMYWVYLDLRIWVICVSGIL